METTAAADAAAATEDNVGLRTSTAAAVAEGNDASPGRCGSCY
jgi:hypothetical protein